MMKQKDSSTRYKSLERLEWIDDKDWQNGKDGEGDTNGIGKMTLLRACAQHTKASPHTMKRPTRAAQIEFILMQYIDWLNASYFDWYLQSSVFVRYLNKTHKRLSHEDCSYAHTHNAVKGDKLLKEKHEAERNIKME